MMKYTTMIAKNEILNLFQKEDSICKIFLSQKYIDEPKII